MQFLITSALIASVIAAPGDGCQATSGASISIIYPTKGAVVAAGTPLTVTWDVIGGDSTYNAIPLTLVVADATNPGNIRPLSGGTIASNVTISAGKVTGTVPASVPAGNYTVEAQFRDTVGGKQLVCFSPVFSVTPAAVATVVTKAATTSSGFKIISGLTAALVSLLAF
ncbi:hypothetical protein HDU99_005857 [Rhizoclosmatium hyalinum]|nr:hypothetical protein HDU99_005857 [Rhizoclosmatium hyalinum]